MVTDTVYLVKILNTKIIYKQEFDVAVIKTKTQKIIY